MKGLKECREDAGYTQSGLASALGCSPVVVHKYEVGKMQATAPVIIRYAKVLKVTTDKLIGYNLEEEE